MDIFQTIADFVNTIVGALKGLSLIGGLLPHTDSTPPDTPPERAPEAPREAPPSGSGRDRCTITIPENINPNARFMSRGSPAWANQTIPAEDGQTYYGIHGGTDFVAPPGSPVFAARAMTVIAVGRYTDAGRMGDYVIGNWQNGMQYYSGHLDNVKVKTGDNVACGQQLGQTNQYAHTHIQLKRGSVYLDPEKYL